MDERETAISAAESTCPRCGAQRDPDQQYCLECGLVLPEVSGRLPSWRRRWIRRLGWYPKTNGRPSALQSASKAAHSGLNQVGVLDSSLYASLQPGYYVVFSGVYPAKADADAAVATARQAGFGGAYSRQIAR